MCVCVFICNRQPDSPKTTLFVKKKLVHWTEVEVVGGAGLPRQNANLHAAVYKKHIIYMLGSNWMDPSCYWA